MSSEDRLPLVGYIVHGSGGKHPGTAHVRVLNRVEHARQRGTARWEQLDPVEYVRGADDSQYAAIVIQRDSVPASLVEALCDRAQHMGTRVLVELDDDLVSNEARGRLAIQGYSFTGLNGVRRLIERADEVIVTTAYLAELVGQYARSVLVVPNMLNASLWTIAPHNERYAEAGWNKPRRVLYMGTTTHSDDLRLLERVFRPHPSQAPRRDLVLEVVGVSKSDSGWFTRLEIPRNGGNYPEFVAWLQSQRGRWDVGVAPLLATDFNRSKSDLKFLEYTALGLPTVASRRGPYDSLDQHGATLVGDDPEEWSAALVQISSRADIRREAVATAQDFVKRERLIGAAFDSVRDWENVILGSSK